MSVSRRLLREREEAVRELSRLHDQMVESHDNIIMTLQVLAEENTSLRERVNGVRQSQPPREHVESVIGYVTNLHERWQHVKKTWFGSSLVNMKHRMLLVEESWKKLKHRSHRTVATAHHPLDVFRGKLCAVRAQGGEGRLGDLPCLCSSEESIASLFPFSEDEDVYEGINECDYEVLPLSSTLAKNPGEKQVRQSSTNTPSGKSNKANTLPNKLSTKPASEMEEDIYSETLPYRLKGDSGQVNSVSGEVVASSSRLTSELAPSENKCSENKNEENNVTHPVKSNVLQSTPKYTSPEVNSSHRPYWTDPSLSASLSILTELSPGERLPKEEINARLKELALTSESGSCSVLEVIEPSSEESDTAQGDIICNLNQVEPAPSNDNRSRTPRTKRLPSRKRLDDGEIGSGSRGEGTTSSESGTDCNPHSETALGTTDNTKHFLANETTAGSAAAFVSDSAQRSEPPPLAAPPLKRKGFLHKFIKPSKWANKKKKAPESSAGDTIFKLTIERSHSVGDPTDSQHTTTPESNTSSSHDYNSNSSEDSSLGKSTITPTSLSSNLNNIAKPIEQNPVEIFRIDPVKSLIGVQISRSPHPNSPNDSETASLTLSARSQELDRKSESNLSYILANNINSTLPNSISNNLSNNLSNPLSNNISNNISANINVPNSLSNTGNTPPSRSVSPPPVPSRRPLLQPVHSPDHPTPSPTNTHQEFEGNNDMTVSSVTLSNNKVTISESRSVATSEDSGIVARPASSASKSDSISRPESSSSSFPPFKSSGDITNYSLQKSNLSLTQDLISATPDSSSHAGRMSPAPSEVSKTESALSPPSQASDISKSESSRQASVGKASLASSTKSSSNGSAHSHFPLTSLMPLKKDLNVKTAAIIDISHEQQKVKDEMEMGLDSLNSDTSVENCHSSNKKERAWYDLSDEESDILLPDRLTPKAILRHSSSEEENEVC